MPKYLNKTVTIILKIYKYTISNLFYLIFGGGCKYNKTCSEFAIEAVENKGVVKGLILSFKRFLSCQPFSKNEYITLEDIS